LGVVVAMLRADVIAPILEEIVHRRVRVVDDLDLVSFDPDLDADQSNVHVEWPIKLPTTASL